MTDMPSLRVGADVDFAAAALLLSSCGQIVVNATKRDVWDHSH
jgi:hypothetical protein